MAIFRVFALVPDAPILHAEGVRHLVPVDLVGFVEFRTVGLRKGEQLRRAHELARQRYPTVPALFIVQFPPWKSLWRVLKLTDEGFTGLGHLEAPGSVSEEEVLRMAAECWEEPPEALSVLAGAG